MTWVGILLVLIGVLWFLISPGSKSAPRKGRAKKKKKSHGKEKPHPFIGLVQELLKPGVKEDSVSAGQVKYTQADQADVPASKPEMRANEHEDALLTTPVDQLTRVQLEHLLKAYFKNEGTTSSSS